MQEVYREGWKQYVQQVHLAKAHAEPGPGVGAAPGPGAQGWGGRYAVGTHVGKAEHAFGVLCRGPRA